MSAEAESAIRAVIRQLVAANRDGQADALASLFYMDAVMMPPGSADRLTGRDACVESYRQFFQAATIHGFTDTDHSIDVWGSTAVVTYRFEIDYSIAGGRSTDRGLDVLVLHAGDEGWQITWRTMNVDTH